MKKEQTNSWQKEFREEIIGHDDLNATEPYSVNEPIKGDIYFDGVAMEGFISNLISQEKEKWIKKIKEMKEQDHSHKDCKDFTDCMTFSIYTTSYNKALEKVINLLQNK